MGKLRTLVTIKIPSELPEMEHEKMASLTQGDFEPSIPSLVPAEDLRQTGAMDMQCKTARARREKSPGQASKGQVPRRVRTAGEDVQPRVAIPRPGAHPPRMAPPVPPHHIR